MTATNTASAQNKARGRRWRELVGLVLGTYGVATRMKREFKKISEAIAADQEAGDLQGIPGWTVLARAERTIDLSGGLDAAHAARERDGKEHAAVVFFRRGRPADEAYAVLTLADLATVIRAGQDAS